jgi:hypothetical protein
MPLLYSQANISRQGLAAIPTPPGQGRFHKPYPFAAYVDDVEEALDLVGLQIVRNEFEVNPARTSFFGALEVEPKELVGELITARDYSLIVGLRGSHDQSLPRGLVLGSRVMVCSNLAFSGNIGKFNTKQTLNVGTRLPRLINETVARIPQLAREQDEKFQAFKDYQFTNRRTGDSVLAELVRQGMLSGSQFTRALREWDSPKHIEHAAYGDSAWQLFNAVTEALKPTGATVNHNLLAQRTEAADRLISNIVGLQALAA